MSDHGKDLRAAVIDGRAQTPRFKQRQLWDLHIALEKSKSSILSAICSDSNESQVEAEIQYQQTMNAVAQIYASVDVEALLADEYKIAKSVDNTTRRAPYGYAYIIPSQYHPFYSTVVPVAAAIAAGNCVVLELKQVYAEVVVLLRRILTEALDSETFLIAEQNHFQSRFQHAHQVYLDGRGSSEGVSSTQNIKTFSSRIVAIVDGHADLTSTAKELVRARFRFGGKSPYAPDIVLVDEFVMSQLAKALSLETASYLTAKVGGKDKISSATRNKLSTEKSVLNEMRDENITILASGDQATVALIESRSSTLLARKINEPVLVLHAVSSTDDAIDFISQLSENSTGQLSASYFFCDPPTAKYLSQFVNARLSYTGRIPVELLVGGIAPADICPSIQPRYTTDMFSYPRPDFISVSEKSEVLASVLDQQTQVSASSKSSKLPLISLKPTGEPLGGGIGFFEQGIVTGGVLALFTLVSCSIVSLKYLVPVVINRLH